MIHDYPHGKGMSRIFGHAVADRQIGAEGLGPCAEDRLETVEKRDQPGREARGGESGGGPNHRPEETAHLGIGVKPAPGEDRLVKPGIVFVGNVIKVHNETNNPKREVSPPQNPLLFYRNSEERVMVKDRNDIMKSAQADFI